MDGQAIALKALEIAGAIFGGAGAAWAMGRRGGKPEPADKSVEVPLQAPVPTVAPPPRGSDPSRHEGLDAEDVRRIAGEVVTTTLAPVLSELRTAQDEIKRLRDAKDRGEGNAEALEQTLRRVERVLRDAMEVAR